jgi:hypothetical protein
MTPESDYQPESLFLWERLSASIVAAGKLLPPKECLHTWKAVDG